MGIKQGAFVVGTPGAILRWDWGLTIRIVLSGLMLFIIVMVIKVNLYLLDISNIVQLRVVKYQFRV